MALLHQGVRAVIRRRQEQHDPLPGLVVMIVRGSSSRSTSGTAVPPAAAAGAVMLPAAIVAAMTATMPTADRRSF